MAPGGGKNQWEVGVTTPLPIINLYVNFVQMAFLQNLLFGKEARGNGKKTSTVGTNFACETAVVLRN